MTSPSENKPRFLSDVDDVVGNYVQAFVSAVVALGIRNIKHDHAFDDWDLSKSLKLTKGEDDAVYSLINLPGFAQRLNPCEGAIHGMKQIMQLCDVLWVTSPLSTSPTWAFDRQQWLDHYFGVGQKVVSTHEKYAVDGLYFLDDKPEHTKLWHAEHPMKVAMLWATGRNTMRGVPEGVLLVHSWKDVLEIVKLTANTLGKPA